MTMPDSSVISQRTALFICGMHRSGTSLLARIFNMLGIQLEDNVIVADQNNSTGYWESATLVDINEELLKLLNSSWFDTSELDATKLRQLAQGSIGQKARSFLHAELCDNTNTLLKDPRLNRLMPFWLEICQQLQVRPKIVLALRHPSAVVQSLQQRDQFPELYAQCLWLNNVLCMLKDCTGYSLEIINYHKLLSDWQTELSSVRDIYADFLPESGEDTLKAISEFITPDLQHFQSSADVPDNPVARLANELYDYLVSGSVRADGWEDILLSYRQVTSPYQEMLNWFNQLLNKSEHDRYDLQQSIRQTSIENNFHKKILRVAKTLTAEAVGRPLFVWGAGGGGEKTIWLLEQLGLAARHRRWSSLVCKSQG